MVVPGSELIMAVEAPGVGAGTWAWGNRFLWGYEPEQDDPIIEATVAAAVAAGVRFSIVPIPMELAPTPDAVSACWASHRRLAR